MPIDAQLPSISVLTPTLNSGRTLQLCLASIRSQDYPSGKVEIIIADGGSTDGTTDIARRYGASVVANPGITGEAGKAVAFRHSSGDLVLLIDSDNILPGADWMRQMVRPLLEDQMIIGAEPVRFVSQKGDSVVDRYCAVFGMVDPLCLFVGNYDKFCSATRRWTSLPVRVEPRQGYVAVALDRPLLPTFGANGTLYRRKALEPYVTEYLKDIDVPVQMSSGRDALWFAKVDVGIRHLCCPSVRDYLRKQQRRIRDYFAIPRIGLQEYPWRSVALWGTVKFCLATVLVVPLLSQSARAYLTSRDKAAFFHPVACWLTLYIYAISALFFRGRPLSRAGWRQ